MNHPTSSEPDMSYQELYSCAIQQFNKERSLDGYYNDDPQFELNMSVESSDEEDVEYEDLEFDNDAVDSEGVGSEGVALEDAVE